MEALVPSEMRNETEAQGVQKMGLSTFEEMEKAQWLVDAFGAQSARLYGVVRLFK